MKFAYRVLLTGIISVLFLVSSAQDTDKKKTKEDRKAEKARIKKEKEEKENADWILFQSLAENKRFVAEFDKVTNSKTGEQYTLNRRINFIAVNGNKVVIQFQSHPYLASNGLGGITIDGTITNYKYTPPKNDKKPIVISFNVDSKNTLRGSNIRISVTKGGITTVSMGSSPNIYGIFTTPENANINMGVNMWN